MFRKLMLVLLAGAMCLLAVTSVLALERVNIEVYNATEYEELTGKKLEYQEAPMLRTMVAAGELPLLRKRLPENPLVVTPVDEIGQYGGTIRLEKGPGMAHENFMMHWGYEFLESYSADLSTTYPNVLEGWKGSEDAKKYTLYLRKGLRWSDGVPFTVDDLLFWWEDVALNKDFYPIPPSRMVIAGEPGVMKKIDDYTVEISFSAPFGLFIENLCRWRPDPYVPKHYLKQFHPDYTPMSEIEKVMEKEGYSSWENLFSSKMGNHSSFWGLPERPVLGAYVAQNEITEPIQIYTRNPYYWKVDTEGNQLPYIDKISRITIEDPEAALLKTIAGELDEQHASKIGGLQNYSLIMENRERGNYRIVPTWWIMWDMGAVFFNYAHKDPILKKILNDKRFRIALSVAMDREEISQLVYEGLAVPTQPSVSDGPPYYGERWGKNYLQYDPELANQLLDEMGLTERDKDGYRLRPDGERLRMVNTVVQLKPEMIDIAELYKIYWKEIGIDLLNKPTSYAGWIDNLAPSGNYDIATLCTAMGGRPMNPLYRMGNDTLSTAPAAWTLFIETNGEKGEEPPQEVFQMIELREKALNESDEEKRIALTLEIFKIRDEYLFTIGAVREPFKGRFMVVHNRIRNVTSVVVSELIYSIPAQYFIKE